MLKHMRNLLGGALLAIALGIPYLQAADVAISALPAGAALTGTEAIPAVQSAATVKTTPAAIKTYIETGGTVTASDPVIDASQTWNNGSVMFTGLKINITSTASASGSLLFDVQENGASVFSVRKGQFPQAAAFKFTGASPSLVSPGGGILLGFTNTTTGLLSGSSLGWSDTPYSTATLDTLLSRDAAGQLALRNSTNAQTFRVYSTYTDASNYERLAINAGAAGDWLQLAAETGGTGVDNIGIALTPAGNGAISAHVPDSAIAGGNARGTNAVDWSTVRTLSGQVASGAYSVVAGGSANTASSTGDTVGGGGRNTASGGVSTIAGGDSNTASGAYSWVPGGYAASTRGLYGGYAFGAGNFSGGSAAEAQVFGGVFRRTTTDATPTVLTANGGATVTSTYTLSVPSSTAAWCTANIIGRTSGGDVTAATYTALVKNVSGTTSIVGSADKGASAADAGVAAASMTLIADDTNDTVQIQVTGIAATTFKWVGDLRCTQMLY